MKEVHSLSSPRSESLWPLREAGDLEENWPESRTEPWQAQIVFNAWVQRCGTRDPSPSLVITWVSLFALTTLTWFLSSESEASLMTTYVFGNDGKQS